MQFAPRDTAEFQSGAVQTKPTYREPLPTRRLYTLPTLR